MDLNKLLEKIGLSEKEAKVYLALLEKGDSTATQISELTILDRTLMYQLTNKLIERGFVSYVMKEGVRYFSAADPEILIRDLQEKERELKDALPIFKARQNTAKNKASAGIYLGRKGVYAMLKLIVSQNEPYYCLGGMGEVCMKFEAEAAAAVRDAEKSKVKGKILARKNEKLFLSKYEDLRFLPKQLLSSTSMMMVGTKTVVFIWSDPSHAILIDNEEFTKNNLSTFNYLWDIAEKATKTEIKDRIMKD